MLQKSFFPFLIFILTAGFAATAFALDISGEWAGWGTVVITSKGNGTYSGTYTDTYGTGPGTMQIKTTGERTFEGIWGESPKRHGTFSLIATSDGKTLQGTWKADRDSAIKPGDGGGVLWKKK